MSRVPRQPRDTYRRHSPPIWPVLFVVGVVIGLPILFLSIKSWHTPRWTGTGPRLTPVVQGATDSPRHPTEYRLINAKDEYGDLLPGGLVNVFDDYGTRGRVVAKCPDGAKVAIIETDGDGVRVQTTSECTQRTLGWVSRWFLR